MKGAWSQFWLKIIIFDFNVYKASEGHFNGQPKLVIRWVTSELQILQFFAM